MSSSSFTRPFVTLLLILVVLGAIFGLVTFIRGNNGPDNSLANGTQVDLYFSHSEGDDIVLVPSPRILKNNLKGEALLEWTTEALLHGPDKKDSLAGLYSEIPKGTRLIDITQGEDGWRLNLSGQFTSGGGANSMQLRLAELSKTVEALELQQAVILVVEGRKVSLLGGEGVEVTGGKLSPGTEELKQ